MEPKRRSKTVAALVVAGTVIVVALVAALIVSAVAGNDDGGQGAAAATSSAPTPPPEPEAEEPTGAETTDVDPLGRPVTVIDSASGTPREQTGEPGNFPTGQEMVGAPDGFELQRVRSGATVAVSTSDGPTTTDGQVMVGYAHSARGAGLLAMNLVGLNVSKSVPTKEFLTRFAPADQREVIANNDGYNRENEESTREYLVRGYVAPQHVRFLTCESDFCTVEVATPSIAEAVGQIDATVDPNAHPVARVSMKWAGSQWEMVAVAPRQAQQLDGSWERWS